MNAEHQIIELTSSNSFKIDVGSNATSVVTNNAFKSSGSVTLNFQINVGLITQLVELVGVLDNGAVQHQVLWQHN